MSVQNWTSDRAILEELGKRIARYRLNQNLKQEELATESGIGVNTIYRIEQGNSIQLSNFIRILRTLGIINNLDALIDYQPVSPIEQVKLRKKERQRARQKKNKQQSRLWKWEDEK